MCSGHVISKVWEISDNVSEMVQDRDIPVKDDIVVEN